MSEYDHEPVRGLPEFLPEGEHILWQGAPDWKYLALSALHIRLAAAYFAVVACWALAKGSASGALWAVLLGVALIGLLALFAWGVGRTAVYTLTDKRIVLRVGVALNKCINLPLTEIESANLKTLGQGHGSIALQLKGMPRLGYWMIWPHARSLRIIRPQPMLRAIPDAVHVSQMLFKAAQKVQPVAPVAAPQPVRQNVPLGGVPA
jgi:hypothetical protein